MTRHIVAIVALLLTCSISMTVAERCVEHAYFTSGSPPQRGCNAGWVYDSTKDQFNCSGSCNDNHDDCCNPVCGNYDCAAESPPMNSKTNKATIECTANNVCTASDCCDPVTVPQDCIDSLYATGGTSCENIGLSRKADFTTHTCTGPACQQAECCEPYQSCVAWRDDGGNSCSSSPAYFDDPGFSTKTCSGCALQDCCVLKEKCTDSGGYPTDASCGQGYSKKPTQPEYCSDDNCALLECCQENQSCSLSAFSGGACGTEHTAKGLFGSITCSSSTCAITECCDPNQKCDGTGSLYINGCTAVSANHINKSNFFGKICSSLSCQLAECCDPKQKCTDQASAYQTCNPPYSRKSNHGSIFCATTACGRDECCDLNQKCTDYDMCTLSQEIRVVGHGTKYCTSTSCQRTECCLARQKCTSAFPAGCPTKTTAKFTTGSGDIYCLSTACQQTECCANNETCPQYGSCGSGYTAKGTYAAIVCPQLNCVRSDCCDRNQLCSQSSLYSTCPGPEYSNKSNPPRCSSPACGRDECCNLNQRCAENQAPFQTCPSNTSPLSNHGTKICSTPTCAQSECCEDNQRCTASQYNSCGDATWSKVGNHQTKICSSPACGKLECCVRNEQCSKSSAYANCYLYGAIDGAYSAVGNHATKYCTTTSCGLSECCNLNLMCKDSPYASCPNNFSRLPTHATIYCALPTCEQAECCEPNMRCTTFGNCNDNYSKIGAYDTHICDSASCRHEECCLEHEKCQDSAFNSDAKCGANFGGTKSRIPNQNVYCGEPKDRVTKGQVRCTNAECCRDNQPCSSMKAQCTSIGQGLITSKKTDLCSKNSYTCDTQECCGDQETCLNETCGGVFVRRADVVSSTKCEETECRNEECCGDRRQCPATGLCLAPAVKKPAPLAPNPPFYCAKTECKTEECCGSPGKCSDDIEICTKEGGLAKEGLDPDYKCMETKCQFTECCATKGKCTDFTCPDTSVQKPNYATAGCPSLQCEAKWCCDEKQICQDYTCTQPGYVLDSSKSQVQCVNALCDSGECCGQGGTCDASLCTRGINRLKTESEGLPETCTDVTCSAEECCISLDKCGSQCRQVGYTVTFGKADHLCIAGLDKDPIDYRCTDEECCELLPTSCAGYHCNIAAGVQDKPYAISERLTCKTGIDFDCDDERCCDKSTASDIEILEVTFKLQTSVDWDRAVDIMHVIGTTPIDGVIIPRDRIVLLSVGSDATPAAATVSIRRRQQRRRSLLQVGPAPTGDTLGVGVVSAESIGKKSPPELTAEELATVLQTGLNAGAFDFNKGAPADAVPVAVDTTRPASTSNAPNTVTLLKCGNGLLAVSCSNVGTNTAAKKEDEEDNMMMIFIAGGGVAFILLLVIVYCCCCRSSTKPHGVQLLTNQDRKYSTNGDSQRDTMSMAPVGGTGEYSSETSESSDDSDQDPNDFGGDGGMAAPPRPPGAPAAPPTMNSSSDLRMTQIGVTMGGGDSESEETESSEDGDDNGGANPYQAQTLTRPPPRASGVPPGSPPGAGGGAPTFQAPQAPMAPQSPGSMMAPPRPPGAPGAPPMAPSF